MTKKNTKTTAPKFDLASVISSAPTVSVASMDTPKSKIPNTLASLANQTIVNFVRDGAAELKRTKQDHLVKDETKIDASARYAKFLEVLPTIQAAAPDAEAVEYRNRDKVACVCCAHPLGAGSKAVAVQNASGTVWKVHTHCLERMIELQTLLESDD